MRDVSLRAGLVLLVVIGPAAADGSRCVADEVQTITNSIGMKLALIPAGKFTMGSPRGEAERDDKEVPHEVVISKPFYLGVYEVTQAEFSKVFSNPSEFKSNRGGGPQHPVENVTVADARKFCKDLSARDDEQRAGRSCRLPTEAEWEYACRAGTTAPFHFGDSFSSTQANFNGNHPYGGGKQGPYLRKTAKVGSYQPNAFGLYDMHGNVAEWCADWYDPKYYGKSPPRDPKGPPSGVIPTDFNTHYVVVRGGSWLDDARACRSAYRSRGVPQTKYRLIGFRVACDVKEAGEKP